VTRPAAPSDARGNNLRGITTFLDGDLPHDVVVGAKGSHTISAVIPARDEEATITSVIEAIRPHLAGCGGGLLDEIVVIDDGSRDATAARATHAGARVISTDGSGGKGAAMALGVAEAQGDVIVFLDGDVVNTSPDYIVRLAGPLLLDDRIQLVKGFYERPLEGQPSGGGRVTELTARPILELLFPSLAAVAQPLAGETALRRGVFEQITLDDGYRVEMGLLLDVAATFGTDAIAQVDLGVRVHRNRPLHELRPMAVEVLAAALERANLRRG
jgi:glucosyl-3-phosphoglycerate synthase